MNSPPESASPERNTRILVLDDNVEFGRLLAENLRRAGYVTWHVEKVSAALDVLENESVDVLLTDILMPDHDGIEMIQIARQLRPELRVIAMSGSSPRSGLYLEMSKKLGAAYTLQKPFSFLALVAAIREPGK